jgi:hypothetical protein
MPTGGYALSRCLRDSAGALPYQRRNARANALASA